MARQHILTAILCAADLSCKVLSFSPTSSTWLSHRLASLAGVTKQDERESRHKRKSIATYQDEAYEMFLSNIEKDMIESWKDEMERSMADEVPSFGLDTAFGGEIQRNYDDDDDDDEEESVTVTLESEIDGSKLKRIFTIAINQQAERAVKRSGRPNSGQQQD